MEGREKGCCFLKKRRKKAHGDVFSSFALIQNSERLSCETSGPTQSQNQSLGFRAKTHPIPRATGRETVLRASFCSLVTFFPFAFLLCDSDYLFSWV